MPGQQNNLDETFFVPIGYYPKNDEANKDRKRKLAEMTGSPTKLWEKGEEILNGYRDKNV